MASSTNKPEKSFWIISTLALVWNLMGVNMYLQQAYNTESFRSMYTDEQFELIQATPSWMVSAYAFAVFGGMIGCILLLFRKRLAKIFFIISLLGIIVQQVVYNIFIINVMELYGPGAIIMPLMVVTIGVFLIWYTKRSIAKGWLA